jgi:hypothetical protein
MKELLAKWPFRNITEMHAFGPWNPYHLGSSFFSAAGSFSTLLLLGFSSESQRHPLIQTLAWIFFACFLFSLMSSVLF